MSYLETLRVGTVSVFTGLAVLYKEVDQVETADDGDESSEEILPRLTDILETAYRDRETRDEEGKAYNKREDAVQTEEAINETSYKANDEGTERIAPVFTATCTTSSPICVPFPLQKLQGLVMTSPVPSHRGHTDCVCIIPKILR